MSVLQACLNGLRCEARAPVIGGFTGRAPKSRGKGAPSRRGVSLRTGSGGGDMGDRIFVSGDNVFVAFGPDLQPVARVGPGRLVEVETRDCFSDQITRPDQLVSEIDFSRVNPATGPVYVEGARRGDALAARIVRIEVSGTGLIVTVPGAGVLGDKVGLPKTRLCRLAGDFVEFAGIRVKARKMIGVIGVASDVQTPTGTPGQHGGNLDTTVISEGATVYLPVFREGALFGAGDLHAAMGDGEVCVAGCEVRGRVTVSFGVFTELAPSWPVVETAEAYYILVSDEDVGRAFYTATEQAVKALAAGLGLEWHEAYMLASLAVDIQVSQLVDPRKTVRARIPRELFPSGVDFLKALKG